MKASAVKRGRNPRFPFVPVVIREDGTTHNTNTKYAYATRDEAVAFAQKWIDHSIAHQAKQDAARAARHAAPSVAFTTGFNQAMLGQDGRNPCAGNPIGTADWQVGFTAGTVAREMRDAKAG